jgi:hypothetical protein
MILQALVDIETAIREASDEIKTGLLAIAKALRDNQGRME